MITAAAGRAGEPSWPMPLPAELKKGLDSEVADLVNTGPREELLGTVLPSALVEHELLRE